VEKVNRLKMAEKDRDNLLDSKVEAETFIEKEKNIRRKKNILYQLNERSAADAADQARSKVAQIQEKMQAIKADKEAADKRRAEIEKEYETVKAERAKIEKELNSSTTVSRRCLTALARPCPCH
jgi:chromosome segregation ATPase